MAYLHLHRRLQMSSWQRNILTIAALKVCPLPWSWLCDFPNFPLHNIVAYRTASGYKQFVRREMHSNAFIAFSVSAKFRSSWLESKSDSGFCWVIAREEITWNHLNGNRIGSDRLASHRIVLDWIGLDQVLWMEPEMHCSLCAQGRCAGFYVWYLFPAVFLYVLVIRIRFRYGFRGSQFALDARPMSCVAVRLINKCAKKKK